MFLKIIYKLINSVVKLTFLIISLMKLLFNLKLIQKFDNIVYQSSGGFGHTVFLATFLKYLNNQQSTSKKKYFLIQQYDHSRYNNKLNKSFNIPHLEITRSIGYTIMNKYIVLGDQESRDILSFNEKIIFCFLKFILKNKNILEIHDIYNQLISEFHPNKYSLDGEPFGRRKATTLYFIANKIEPLKLFSPLREKIWNKINYILKKNNKKEIVTIYIRNRKYNNNFDNKFRNSDIDEYKLLTNYLSKKYLILLYGDVKFFKNRVPENVYTHYNLNIDKFAFDIFAATECDYFIGTEGGAQTLGWWSKKKFSVNHYPYGHVTGDTNILFKNVYEGEKKLSKEEVMSKIPFERNPGENFKIVNNSDTEILNFIKSYI